MHGSHAGVTGPTRNSSIESPGSSTGRGQREDVRGSLLLAQYYSAKAADNQRKLAEAEDLVECWGQKSCTVYRNEIPNPYQSAKARAEYFRRQVRPRRGSHPRMSERPKSFAWQ
jgi:hypothetical protein